MKPKLQGIGLAWLVLLSLGAAQKPEQAGVQYKIKWEYNVRIPMRDGVQLSANITRPDAQGRFPVVVDRTPYGKNRKGFLIPPLISPSEATFM